MEKLPYLKDHLQTNIPKLVTIAKRVGQYPETDYKTKEPTGRMQTLYNFHLPDGPTVRHYAKEREEEVLGLFQAGDTVQVVRQEQQKEDGARIAFLVWTPPEGAEARSAASPQPAGNTALRSQQKKLDEKKEEEDAKWLRIDTSKIIYGYMNTEMAKGLAPEAAGAIAERAYQVQEATVDKVLAARKTKELFGGPEFSPEIRDLPF